MKISSIQRRVSRPGITLRRLVRLAPMSAAILLVVSGAPSVAERHGGTAQPYRVQLADAGQDAAKKLFAEGFNLLKQGDLQGAADRFHRGLALDPENALAHYYLAETLRATADAELRSGFREGALSEMFLEYRKAAELAPDTDEGHRSAGFVQRQSAEDGQLIGGRWCYDALTQQLKPDRISPERIEWIEIDISDAGVLRSLSLSRSGRAQKIEFVSDYWLYRQFMGSYQDGGTERSLWLSWKTVFFPAVGVAVDVPEGLITMSYDDKDMNGYEAVFRRC